MAPTHSFLSVPEHSPPFTEEARRKHLLCAWKWNAEMEEVQRLNTQVHIALGLDKKTITVHQEGCDNRDKKRLNGVLWSLRGGTATNCAQRGRDGS